MLSLLADTSCTVEKNSVVYVLRIAIYGVRAAGFLDMECLVHSVYSRLILWFLGQSQRDVDIELDLGAKSVCVQDRC